MKLNWENFLHFNSEKDYYERLGFLLKEEELISVYTENNDKVGTWSGQGRMSLSNVSMDSFPEALKNAVKTGVDGRICMTHYVKILKENHNFSRKIDPTGSDFTKRLYKESSEKVLETVPEVYEKDFIGDITEL